MQRHVRCLSPMMRLLSFDPDGTLSWEEFTKDDIPPYAILSHTWGAEEVTFADLTNGCARNKAGYRKISFCGEQAARDKLRYFWVDSCCIDKSSSAELSEAINSMFRWYQQSEICYVYLCDVYASSPIIDAGTSRSERTGILRKSRWFTRGWTLQELLAPSLVILYSAKHKRLGDKISLAPVISDITGIPQSALRGRSLEKFNFSDRMSWAEHRQTTRDEDSAYCLLGIFNVFLSPIYGEGKQHAMRRLRNEIDQISALGKPLTPLLVVLANNRG